MAQRVETWLPVPSLPGVVASSLGRLAVTLHGAKKADDVLLVCEVNELRLAPKEGGTVEVTFRCQFIPEPEQVAAVGAMLGRQVKVSVRPGEATATDDE